MPMLAQWVVTPHQAGLALRRTFWKPLRNMMDIFHLLPLAAAVLIFLLLATDGQIRELYISYLEGPRIFYVAGKPEVTAESWTLWMVSVAFGLILVAVVSAVLFEAHYALSTMRRSIVYSSYSNPASNSTMHALQMAAGFILAFLPWIALTIGLFNARNFVAGRYCKLLNLLQYKHFIRQDLRDMQHLWMPSGVTIAGALIVLGMATAWFCAGGEKRNGEQRRNARRAVACCAPGVAVLLCVLFTDWLDFQHLNSKRTVAIAVAIVVLTGAYLWIYRKLDHRRGAFFFSGTGISLRRRRRIWFGLWAFLPWLFAGVYFVWAQHPIAPMEPGTCPRAAALLPRAGHWTAFPVAMCYTIALGLVIGHLLGKLSGFRHRRRAVAVIVAAFAVFAVVVSFVNVSAAVTIYRFIGPLGTVMLQLLLLIATCALLAALSQRSGFPVLTLVVLTLVVALMFPRHLVATAAVLGLLCLGVAAMASISGRHVIGAMMVVPPLILGIHAWELRNVQSVGQNPKSTRTSTVKYQFSCWLNQRGVPITDTAAKQDPQCRSASSAGAGKAWHQGDKYPVFIVAVEGGGIYAASAASIFLSELEDLDSQFDDHVFVVSGVSGGSIGAAVFQALDRETHQSSAPKSDGPTAQQVPPCPQYRPMPGDHGKRDLESEASNIMEDDHLSPVIGSVFTEILGLPLNRADSLVASFEDSTASEDSMAGQDLCAPFQVHWQPGGFAPALALNTTWVEMGYRAAFAPFTLNDLDESLYSFTDKGMPEEKNISLMQAAGVSARFPVIMPPFAEVMSGGKKRWNFVDGGYADNSGATTALDIYKAVESVSPQYVDLRLILITSSIPQPDMTSNDISGTVFGDTVAPLDALMKVREDLGNEAVASACTYVYHDDQTRKIIADVTSSGRTPASSTAKASQEFNEPCIKHAGGKFSFLDIVEIQDQTYGLSLGWKISKTSFEVVSRMLGKPIYCPGRNNQSTQITPVAQQKQSDAPATASNPYGQISNDILERNSCVLQTIVELVNGTLPDPVESAANSPP
jgi:hypothetical protein